MEGKIGRYQILGELGRGGMSVVYLGRDPQLERQVAIKVLHAHLASDEQSRQRFGQEARAVARLRHPNIIEVYDFSQETDDNYLVVEYVKGRTLKQFAEDNNVFFPEVAAVICLAICRAVAHAHSLGIIHRDIKPENVMVSEAGELKLMDFGIAKVLDGSKQLTLTGSLIGSPAHMAPEVLEGAGADFRSDIFSIGTILYWLACGRLPFSGSTPHQVIKNIVEGRYQSPQEANPAVGSLAGVIVRALEKAPERRYPDASAMAGELEKFLAEGGFAEADVWLKDVLTRPVETLERMRRQVVDEYFSAGRRTLNQRRRAAALSAFDRVLALEPGHKGVLEALARLRKGEKLKRLLWYGGAAILLAAMLAGVWLQHELEPPRPMLPPQIATKEAVVPVTEQPSFKAAPPPEVEEKAPTARNLFRPRKVRPPQAEAARPAGVLVQPSPVAEKKYPVAIVVEPYFHRMYVDGQLVASAEDRSSGYGQFFRGELAEGEHRVVIEHPASAEDAFVIKVPSAGEIRRKLRFLPALVYLDLEGPVAVFIDGEYRGRVGGKAAEPLVITMEDGPERKVRLRLVDDRQHAWEQELRLRAGEKTRLNVAAAEFSGRESKN